MASIEFWVVPATGKVYTGYNLQNNYAIDPAPLAKTLDDPSGQDDDRVSINAGKWRVNIAPNGPQREPFDLELTPAAISAAFTTITKVEMKVRLFRASDNATDPWNFNGGDWEMVPCSEGEPPFIAPWFQQADINSGKKSWGINFNAGWRYNGSVPLELTYPYGYKVTRFRNYGAAQPSWSCLNSSGIACNPVYGPNAFTWDITAVTTWTKAKLESMKFGLSAYEGFVLPGSLYAFPTAGAAPTIDGLHAGISEPSDSGGTNPRICFSQVVLKVTATAPDPTGDGGGFLMVD